VASASSYRILKLGSVNIKSTKELQNLWPSMDKKKFLRSPVLVPLIIYVKSMFIETAPQNLIKMGEIISDELSI
jgi:hypothetical protein